MVEGQNDLLTNTLLDPNLPPIPAPNEDDFEDVKKKRLKHEEDELMCRGHILNSLTDHLYDLYQNISSPKEIWTALDKFCALKYFEFKMNDDSPMDQCMSYKFWCQNW